MTGTYTLAIEGRVWDNAPLDFGLRVSRTGNTPPSDRSQGAALALGARIDGSLVNAEETDLYSFTLAGPARVAFDSMTNDAGKAWTLIGPRGVEMSNRAFSASDPYEANGGDPKNTRLNSSH